MASSPITSWQIDEEKMQAVTDLIFLGFKITVDGDCSHEIQRCLLIGRNAMINLDSVLKSRDITLLKKVHIVKTMATHSSTLAWKLPRTEEPGRLQSMGSLRIRTRLSNFTFTFPFMHWRRKWLPTPVFLPRESQGRGSLVGCRLWGRTESDTTEVT